MTTLKKRRNTQHHEKPAVTVYITPTCVNCPKTLRVLRDHQISHTIIDLSKDKTAYTYVTQDLGYRSAPIIEVKHGWENTTWSGHHLDFIDEHIIAHYQHDTEDDRMTQAHANTTAAIRASGLGGSTTGPHLHFETHTKED